MNDPIAFFVQMYHINFQGNLISKVKSKGKIMEKLNFMEFVNVVKSDMEKKMGENVRIDIHDTVKNNNVSYKAISIVRQDCNVSPNLRLEDFYEDYLEGIELETVLDNIVTIFEKYDHPQINLECFLDFEKVKDHIMIKLVSYEANKTRMENVPHILFLDFAVTYFVYMKQEDFGYGNGSVQIENEHLEMWGVKKEQLHQLALKNSVEKMPEKFRSIQEILIEMLNQKGIETDDIQNEMTKMQDEIPMYVLSNEQNYFGASVLYYPGVLKEISKRFQSDLIILPSSIHEVIVLPVNGKEQFDEMNEMIKEINKDQVADEEVLSDHLYYYNRSTEKLMIPSLSL